MLDQSENPAASHALSQRAAMSRSSPLRDFAALIWRRRRACVSVCLLMLAYLVFESTFVDPTYRSTLRMRMTSDRPTLALSPELPQWLDASAAGSRAAMVSSQSVLDGVIDRLGLTARWSSGAESPDAAKEEALTRLTKSIYVHPGRDRDVLLIDASDSNPALAIQLANAVFDEFDRQSAQTYREQSDEALKTLREQGDRQYAVMRDAQDLVLAARSKLDETAAAKGSADASEQVAAPAQSAGLSAGQSAATALRERVTRIHLELDETRSRLAVLHALQTQSAYSNAASFLHDDQATKLLDQMRRADEELTDLTDRFGPNYPAVSHQSAIVAQLQRRLDQRVTECVQAMEMEQTAQSQHLRDLEQQSAGNITTSADTAQLAQAYENAMLEADLQTRVYQSLRDRLQKASIESQLPRATAQVIERPIQAQLDVAKRLCDMPLVAVGLMILLSLATARIADWLDISVRTGADAANALGTTHLATLRQRPRLIDDEETTPEEIEAYRMIVARLRFADANNEMHALAVTSVARNEGRSSLAANLACLYAAQGQRVLLIDTDLARASQHERFNVTLAPGLVDFIEGSAALDDVIAPTDVANVWLTPAGTLGAKTSPTPLQIAALSRQAQSRFDMVIYDTAPLSEASDAAIVAREAHYVLCVARTGAAKQPELAAAGEMLGQARCKIVGVLFNQSPATNTPIIRESTPDRPHYSIARTRIMRDRMQAHEQAKTSRTKAA